MKISFYDLPAKCATNFTFQIREGFVELCFRGQYFLSKDGRTWLGEVDYVKL